MGRREDDWFALYTLDKYSNVNVVPIPCVAMVGPSIIHTWS